MMQACLSSSSNALENMIPMWWTLQLGLDRTRKTRNLNWVWFVVGKHHIICNWGCWFKILALASQVPHYLKMCSTSIHFQFEIYCLFISSIIFWFKIMQLIIMGKKFVANLAAFVFKSYHFSVHCSVCLLLILARWLMCIVCKRVLVSTILCLGLHSCCLGHAWDDRCYSFLFPLFFHLGACFAFIGLWK